MSFSFLVTWHVRAHEQPCCSHFSLVLLHTGLEKTHQLRSSSICGFRKFVCVCVCIRQCVTSRKLLSADLHNALFPLSRSEKQASFARRRRGKTRQKAVQYRRATCGYNKRAQVLNKQSSHCCYHVPAIICQTEKY